VVRLDFSFCYRYPKFFSFEAGSVTPGPGAFAEYAILEEDISIRIPKGVSFEEAATFPLCSLAAAQVCSHRQHLLFRMGVECHLHQALFIRLEINAPFASPYQFVETFQHSPSILVYSGATSLGLFAIGLARNLRTRGGHPYRIFATASPKNHNKLLALGVEAVYDYRSPTWPEEVRHASGGISYAVDCISEDDSTALISQTFVKDGGKIAVVRKATWRKEGVRQNVIPVYGAVMSGLGNGILYNGKAAFANHSKFTNHLLIQVKFFLHGDRSRLRFTNIYPLALPKILQSFQSHRILFASCLVVLSR